jgi:TLC domain
MELGKHGIFPPPPPQFLTTVTPYCELLGLNALPSHLHVVIGAALFYQALFLLFPLVHSRLQCYTTLPTRAKLNWDIHAVSMIQCLLICYLAYLALGDPQLLKDRVFGYSPFGADVSALACGYFIWDTYVSVRYAKLFGLGFALHGIASLAVFLFGFVCPLFPLRGANIASFFDVLWTCSVIFRSIYSIFECSLVFGKISCASRLMVGQT